MNTLLSDEFVHNYFDLININELKSKIKERIEALAHLKVLESQVKDALLTLNQTEHKYFESFANDHSISIEQPKHINFLSQKYYEIINSAIGLAHNLDFEYNSDWDCKLNDEEQLKSSLNQPLKSFEKQLEESICEFENLGFNLIQLEDQTKFQFNVDSSMALTTLFNRFLNLYICWKNTDLLFVSKSKIHVGDSFSCKTSLMSVMAKNVRTDDEDWFQCESTVYVKFHDAEFVNAINEMIKKLKSNSTDVSDSMKLEDDEIFGSL